MRRRFSVCIPAYNRAKYLPALLNSIMAQDYRDFEVVICEDGSTEREQIRHIVASYAQEYPGFFRYYENLANLGYDANIRCLVEKARGEFCFFMGNDDVMCEGALTVVSDVIDRKLDVGLVLKSYAWFDDVPEEINQEVRYFSREIELKAGREAISVCFRRSGVISGYIVHRDLAHQAATEAFDGTLYYQLHLTASVLSEKNAVVTPRVLVLCRNGEPPEFGHSGSEKGKYVPGHYTPEARLRMIAGALAIVGSLRETRNIDVVDDVVRDYANYFYPYIKDQLSLSAIQFWRLYREFSRMGFAKYPLFHFYCFIGYLLGESRFDRLTKVIRKTLGRTPHIGILKGR